MGLRRLGTSDAWSGSGVGGSFGAKGTGQPWLEVEPGGYEIYIETSQGRLQGYGYSPTFTVPNGDVLAGPIEIYVWAADVHTQQPGGGPLL